MIRGMRETRPASLRSWNAFQTPVAMTPSPVGTRIASGTRHRFWDQISSPTVFFPSIVTGW